VRRRRGSPSDGNFDRGKVWWKKKKGDKKSRGRGIDKGRKKERKRKRERE